MKMLPVPVLGLDRVDGLLRRVVTKQVGGARLPQQYSSKPVAVPTWREFVRYLGLVPPRWRHI